MRNNHLINLCDQNHAQAYMGYDIAISGCGELSLQAAASRNRGKLSMKPGTISSGNLCGVQETDICIPSCVCAKTESVSVDLEKPAICVNTPGKPENCDGCCIYTETNCFCTPHANYREEVSYTVVFTNHSNALLDTVRIFCSVPRGVTVIESSIRPVPRQGETLQTGITVGNVEKEHSVKLEFTAVVEPKAPSKLVFRAHAGYCYEDCAGCCRHGVGGECVCVVEVKGVCLGECVQKCLDIADFRCLCDCFVYHTDTKRFKGAIGNVVMAGYGITVKYVDNDGKKRSRDFKDTVIFFLPEGAVLNHRSIRFANVNCCCDRNGCIAVVFDAELCCCANTNPN